MLAENTLDLCRIRTNAIPTFESSFDDSKEFSLMLFEVEYLSSQLSAQNLLYILKKRFQNDYHLKSALGL